MLEICLKNVNVSINLEKKSLNNFTAIAKPKKKKLSMINFLKVDNQLIVIFGNSFTIFNLNLMYFAKVKNMP